LDFFIRGEHNNEQALRLIELSQKYDRYVEENLDDVWNIISKQVLEDYVDEKFAKTLTDNILQQLSVNAKLGRNRANRQ
jgi:hypothetical protein